jgi:hypothetical protein
MASIKAGDFAQASVTLKGLTKKYPKRALYWFNLGGAQFAQGSYAEAIQSYVAVIKLKNPLQIPSRLYISRALRQMEKPTLAARMLSSLNSSKVPPHLGSEIQKERQSLSDDLFEKAVLHYRHAEYQDAVDKLDAYLRLSPDSEGYMMRGLAQLRVNQPKNARDSFARAENLSRVESQKNQAQYFLNQVRENAWRKGFWVAANIDAGYLNNIFTVASEDSPVSAPLFGIGVRVGKQFYDRDNLSISGMYGITWEEALGEPDGRFLATSLSSDATYNPAPWTLRLSPLFTYQYYGTDPAQFRLGAQAVAGRFIGPVFAEANFSILKNSAASSLYGYLTGNTQDFELRGTLEIPAWTFVLFYRYTADAIGDLSFDGGLLPLANSSHGFGAQVDWTITAAWMASLSLTYAARHFPTIALPDNASRNDNQTTITAKAVHRLSPTIELYAQSDLVLNSSTLGANSIVDRNYTQIAFRTGVLWDILQ